MIHVEGLNVAIQTTINETNIANNKGIKWEIVCDSISYNKLRFEADLDPSLIDGEGCFTTMDVKVIHDRHMTIESKNANGYWNSVSIEDKEIIQQFYY